MTRRKKRYKVWISVLCKDAGNYTMTISLKPTYWQTQFGSGYVKGTHTIDFTITGSSNGNGGGNNSGNNGNSGNGNSNNGGNGSNGSSNGGSGSNGSGSSSGSNSGGSSANTPAKTNYSSEWVNGKWYNADGSQTYPYTMNWKCNATGWWIEDTVGFG